MGEDDSKLVMQGLFERVTAVLDQYQNDHPNMPQGDVLIALSNVSGYIIAQAPESHHRQILDHAISVLEQSTHNFVAFLRSNAKPQ